MSWQRIVENRLAVAVDEGLFDNLAGKGKPLVWEDEAFVPPAWRVAFHLLSQSGLAPVWIMLEAEIRKDHEAASHAFSRAVTGLEKDDPECARAAQQFSRRLVHINKLIDEFNLRVPLSGLARSRLNPGVEIEHIRCAPSAGRNPTEGDGGPTGLS